LLAHNQSYEKLAVAPATEELSHFMEAELPSFETLNEPDDATGEVEEPNEFFRRFALAV
jgi:hypothetical protein